MAYSEIQKVKALTLLATNGNDYKKTSEQIGIPPLTLWRWNKGENEKNDNKKSLRQMLELAAEELFEMMPTEWSGNSWAVAIGIITDKILLLDGNPTSRSETIATKLGSMEPEKLEEIMQEAMDIVAGAEREKAE